MAEQEPSPQDEAGATVPADAKEKMRAALERKQAGQHHTSQGRENTGAVHGSETVGGRRMYRRKTGG